jgi:hypothetical protein
MSNGLDMRGGESASQAHTYLNLLFEQAVEDGYAFSLFCLPSQESRFFTSISEGAQWAEAKAKKQNVYACMGLFSPSNLPEGRGDEPKCAGICALWADVDVANDSAHKGGKKYAPTAKDAEAVCHLGGLNPSFLVNSGYGLHAYWLLDEPRTFTSAEDRHDVKVLASRHQGTIAANARDAGFTIDSTADLVRVLRVAGTTNFKANTTKPVSLALPSKIARYSLNNDLEPMMIAAEYVRTGAELLGAVSSFRIDPGVRISGEVLSLFESQNPELWRTWTMTRQDMKDQSPSAYEMSLANQFVRAGLSDQIIVDYLIHWRRDVVKKPKLRVDYYQRTLGKARSGQSSEKAMRDLADPTVTPPTTDRSLLTTNDRASILNTVRAALNLNVAKVVQLNRDDAEFFIILDNGEEFSVGGVSNITRFATFRDRVVERTGVLIPPDRNNHWPRIISSFFALVEHRETDEPTTDARTRGLIVDYFEKTKIYSEDEWTQALQENYPFVRRGMVWVNMRAFIAWLSIAKSVRMSEREAKRDFHLLKMERARHEGEIRVGVIRRPWYWGLPVDEFTTLMARPRSAGSRSGGRREGGASD